MRREISILVSALILLVGCTENDSQTGGIQIEREYVTVHEDGLATIRFFEPRQVGEDLWAKCFSVPPSFLGSETDSGGGVADPFADPVDHTNVQRFKRTAQNILESAGISFADGHYARYYPADLALVVVLPLEQMELVEAYMMSIGSGPARSMFVYAEIYDVEEALHLQLQRSMQGETDHTAERNALFKAASLNECRLEDAVILTTRNGMRSKTENEESGTELEVDTVLGADGYFVDLAIRYRDGVGKNVGSEEQELAVNTKLHLEIQKYTFAGSWKVGNEGSPMYRYLFVMADAAEERE